MGISNMGAVEILRRVCLRRGHTCLIKLEDNVLKVVDVGALLVLESLSASLPLHFPQRLRCALMRQDTQAL